VSGNALSLTGRIRERQALRYTPAGIPALDFQLHHASRQMEAGSEREVECSLRAVAFGETARRLTRVAEESLIECAGFITARRRGSAQIDMHVTEFKIVEGN
jgi:primosomal replication protein N